MAGTNGKDVLALLRRHKALAVMGHDTGRPHVIELLLSGAGVLRVAQALYPDDSSMRAVARLRSQPTVYGMRLVLDNPHMERDGGRDWVVRCRALGEEKGG